MDITGLLREVARLIINPIITLAFAVAVIVFFWGIVEFISSETADAKRTEGQRKIIYGLLGMFVMVSAYGLVRLVMLTVFGVSPSGYPFD